MSATPVTTSNSRWPRWLRRGPLELAACALIGVGVLMLLQPFAIELYTYSFVTIAGGHGGIHHRQSKFPE